MNFDEYLNDQLKNPAFAERFEEAGMAWEEALCREELGLDNPLVNKVLAESEWRLGEFKSRIAELESALIFYAERGNYARPIVGPGRTGPNDMDDDCGERARKALADCFTLGGCVDQRLQKEAYHSLATYAMLAGIPRVLHMPDVVNAALAGDFDQVNKDLGFLMTQPLLDLPMFLMIGVSDDKFAEYVTRELEMVRCNDDPYVVKDSCINLINYILKKKGQSPVAPLGS